MTKTILITGATDGIGLETAKLLAAQGHTVLMHGRSQQKLDAARKAVGGKSMGYLADLSRMAEIVEMADAIMRDHTRLDVLINNAGILKTPDTVTADGLDIRFMVNTIAPFALTERLLSLMAKGGRIVNLSSAAQAPVDVAALQRDTGLAAMDAYAQSKLAITMWTQDFATTHPDGPVAVAVNPGSLLASKMVKEGFGIAGNDLSIGAEILRAAALEDAFSDASGRYFDNDAGRFGAPHGDANDPAKVASVMQAIRAITTKLINS